MRKFFLEEVPTNPESILKSLWELTIKEKFYSLYLTKLILPNKYHTEILSDHLIRAYCIAAKQYKDPLLSFAALTHDIGKVGTSQWCPIKKDYTFHKHEIHGSKLVHHWMLHQNFTKEEAERVRKVIKHHGFRFYPDSKESTILTWLVKLGRQGYHDVIRLSLIDRAANLANEHKPLMTKEYLSLTRKIQSWIDSERILFPEQLVITGQEIRSSLVDKKLYQQVILDLVYTVSAKPEFNTKEYLRKQVSKYGVFKHN